MLLARWFLQAKLLHFSLLPKLFKAKLRFFGYQTKYTCHNLADGM